MKSKKPWLAISIYSIMGLLLALSLWLLFYKKPVEVEIAEATIKPFRGNILVDGTIRARHKITIAAFATGDIERIDLQVGDPVRKGQILTYLKWDYRQPVISPISGLVSKILRDSDGPVARGEPLLELIDPMDLEIVAEILTTDAVKIPEGAKVQISGLGSKEVLEGRVERISQAGFVKLSALGVEEEKTNVYVKFTKWPESRIGDNFHVELDIDIYNKDQALQIPLGALFRVEGNWAVFGIKDNRAAIRQVEVSNKNSSDAIIESGLQAGEKVIVFPSDQISEGTRVKIREP